MDLIKQDIHEIKQNAVTKLELTNKLEPLQHEIDSLKKRLSNLQITGNSDPDYMSKDQMQMMNAVDPAFGQLAFKNFKEMTESTRTAYIDSLLHDANIHYSFVDHIYMGPKENRKLSGISLVKFPTVKDAEKALSKHGGKNKEFEISDKIKIILKPAISKINLKRNSSLRKTQDLMKNSPLSNYKEVKLKFKER